MAQELSDAQLLSCPEPLEEMFIHRGRRDLIALQADKRKGFSNFQRQATRSLDIHFH